MKPQYIIGGLVIVILAVFGWMALSGSSVEYTNVSRAASLGKTVQVVGSWVKEDGFSYNSTSNIFKFTLQDETGKRIPVELEGAKPNNFELSISVVARGRVENGVFKAKDVLTKCPSKYEGKAPSQNT